MNLNGRVPLLARPASMQAKLDRAQAKRAAKRHAELVKQSDKILKKKGGSREAALKLLQEAFKQQRAPETLLRIAELQYQLDRYTAAVASANLLISSQPSPMLMAAAQAVVQRCGTQAKLDEMAPAPPIESHLDMVLEKSTAASPVPRDMRVAASAAPRVDTNPWASDIPASKATMPTGQRSPSKEAVSKADALFARALPAPPSRPTAIVAAANPFGSDETASGLPSSALPPRDPVSPAAASNPFTDESSTSLVVASSLAIATQPENAENNPFADEPSNAVTSTAPGEEAESSTSLVVAKSSALSLQPDESADATALTDRTSGGTEILEAD